MTNFKKPTPISPALANRIFELAEKHHGSRVALFFKLAYLTGMRFNELLNTKFIDISMVDNKLLITNNKAGCDSKYVCLLPNEVIPIVHKLRDNFPSDTYLFQSKNSNNRINAEPKPLSRQYLCLVMKEINEITRKTITISQFRQEVVNKITNKKMTMSQFRQEFVNKNLSFK